MMIKSLRCLRASRAFLQWNHRNFSRRFMSVEREAMGFDVLIVGGGPAGLSASIRLKQLAPSLSVCLIDKGSEIGAHILSGNVFDPKALHELLPEQADPDSDSFWVKELQSQTGSIATPVTTDQFSILTQSSSYTIPNAVLPSQLHNHGNYILSLSQLCRYLSTKAEDLGVEIYPGFSAAELLYENNSVAGVATRDVGIAKDGSHKDTFEPGVELRAKHTILAEGARGSCTEALMTDFHLRENAQPQTYGLGIKEVWQVPPEQHRPGFVQHTLGFPLQDSLFSKTFGGSFLYHQAPDLVLVGLVVGLDYANPYLNPYQEFQQWKTHPEIRQHLEGGQCLSYGARVLNEGGYHSIPKLTVPGASLVGCGAGFLNAVKIKGSHTAMKTGMLCAEALAERLQDEIPVAESSEIPTDYAYDTLTEYESAFRRSWVHDELYQVRNAHAAFQYGTAAGLVYTGLATHITQGREPWVLSHHTKRDCDATEPARNFTPIDYPPADNKLTFDLLTNLQRAGTYHAEDQPSHLKIKPACAEIPESQSLPDYGAPESRFCPAGVYEYVDEKLVINAQNCIHCKCCSIKTPGEYIEWTVPEGGGGPQYQVM